MNIGSLTNLHSYAYGRPATPQQDIKTMETSSMVDQHAAGSGEKETVVSPRGQDNVGSLQPINYGIESSLVENLFNFYAQREEEAKAKGEEHYSHPGLTQVSAERHMPKQVDILANVKWQDTAEDFE